MSSTYNFTQYYWSNDCWWVSNTSTGPIVATWGCLVSCPASLPLYLVENCMKKRNYYYLSSSQSRVLKILFVVSHLSGHVWALLKRLLLSKYLSVISSVCATSLLIFGVEVQLPSLWLFWDSTPVVGVADRQFKDLQQYQMVLSVIQSFRLISDKKNWKKRWS